MPDLHIENRPLADLTPYEHNARKNDEAVGAVAQITLHGDQQLVTVES